MNTEFSYMSTVGSSKKRQVECEHVFLPLLINIWCLNFEPPASQTCFPDQSWQTYYYHVTKHAPSESWLILDTWVNMEKHW